MNHLGMDAAAVPAVWREAELDETPLLEDILTGGLYGVDYPLIWNGNSHSRAITWARQAVKTIKETE